MKRNKLNNFEIDTILRGLVSCGVYPTQDFIARLSEPLTPRGCKELQHILSLLDSKLRTVALIEEDKESYEDIAHFYVFRRSLEESVLEEENNND